MAESTVTTHSVESKPILESKLRRFKILSAVLAIALVVLAVYAFRADIILLINGPPVGQRLTGINTQLSSSELSAINNAPNSYYEIAGEELLNLSIPGEAVRNGSYVGVVYVMQQPQIKPLVLNGKPSIIYVGAISCVYCAENRWAMAMALSRFGNFSALYKGYSALGDADVPTLYWAPQKIAGNGSVEYKNYYRSNYVNFFSAEYDSPIKGGFQAPSGGYSFYVQNAQNQNDSLAMEFISALGSFKGTPATIFGSTFNGGADAVIFGQANSTTQAANLPPITFMTHAGILNQLQGFNTTFAVEEYAAADVYVAETCLAINDTAAVCTMPAIRSIERIITG